MDKKLLIIFFAILIIMPLVFIGCKGKVEGPPESQDVADSSGTIPIEGPLGTPITEPSETVAKETIPPTATPEVTVKPAAASEEGIDRNKEIQRALKNAGFYAGTIDGKIGPKTKKAILGFQKANGLKVDGKIGPKTWAELEKYLILRQAQD